MSVIRIEAKSFRLNASLVCLKSVLRNLRHSFREVSVGNLLECSSNTVELPIVPCFKELELCVDVKRSLVQFIYLYYTCGNVDVEAGNETEVRCIPQGSTRCYFKFAFK